MYKKITLLSLSLGVAMMHMAMTDAVAGAPVADPDAKSTLSEKQATLLARFEAAITSGVKEVEEYFETGLLNIEAFITDSKFQSASDEPVLPTDGLAVLPEPAPVEAPVDAPVQTSDAAPVSEPVASEAVAPAPPV